MPQILITANSTMFIANLRSPTRRNKRPLAVTTANSTVSAAIYRRHRGERNGR